MTTLDSFETVLEKEMRLVKEARQKEEDEREERIEKTIELQQFLERELAQLNGKRGLVVQEQGDYHFFLLLHSDNSRIADAWVEDGAIHWRCLCQGCGSLVNARIHISQLETFPTSFGPTIARYRAQALSAETDHE